MRNIIILGAGGHGRVVAEAAEQEGIWDRIAFLDDRTDVLKVLGLDIVGKFDDYINLIDEFQFAVAAVGDNARRVHWLDKLKDAGYSTPVILHPKSYVSKYSTVGEGTVILAGAVINTNCRIGRACIININSCVDHDCEIGDGVHISSGAVVRSISKIDRLSGIGAASCVKSGSCIGQGFLLPDGSIAEGNMTDIAE
jgi:sugar O-acyltransferase (sialic acid O-acetyltransferase NeuD family)